MLNHPRIADKLVRSTSERKESLRRDMLYKRLRLPFEEVLTLSSLVQKRFLAHPQVHAAHRLALYASFQNEVLTDLILEYAISHKKEVFFPRVIKGMKGLNFIKVKGKEDLSPGSYDIREPLHGSEANIAAPSSFDIVVVPGIAFDVQGNRLGYGKGYYDKVLAEIKGRSFLAAIAYNMQIVKTLPEEGHDVKMDMIFTESMTLDIERSDEFGQ